MRVVFDILANLLMMLVIILFFGLIFWFAWNVGVVGSLNIGHKIGFMNAFAIISGGYIVNFIFNLYYQKFLSYRQNEKLYEKLLMIEQMQKQVQDLMDRKPR